MIKKNPPKTNARDYHVIDQLSLSRIWHHLLEIAVDQTTIVITTHYIEEARQAHLVHMHAHSKVLFIYNFDKLFAFQVGLMRDGTLLAEAPPTSLIQEQNLPVSIPIKR